MRFLYVHDDGVASHQPLRRALELVAVRGRGIKCNVGTFTAVMNVCTEANQMDLALDVYH